MNDDNMRQKAASEKMKDVLAELMKLNLPSGDVLRAADSANKDKIDIFLNLSEQLRVSYVLKLTGLASGPSRVMVSHFVHEISSFSTNRL
ncbi:hypothetical protein Tco_1085175 [Tanacetum coccineum]